MTFISTIYIIAIYISTIYIVYIYIFASIFTSVEIIRGIWFRSVTWLPQSPVTVLSFPFSQNEIVLCDPHTHTWNNANNHLSYFVYKLYTAIWWFFDFVQI